MSLLLSLSNYKRTFVSCVSRATEVFLEEEVLEVLTGKNDKLVCLDLLDPEGHLGHQDSGDRLGPLDPRDHLDPGDHLGPLDPLDRLDPKDHLGRQDLQDRLDLGDHLGPLDPRDPLGPLDPRDPLGPLDPRDRLDLGDHLGRRFRNLIKSAESSVGVSRASLTFQTANDPILFHHPTGRRHGNAVPIATTGSFTAAWRSRKTFTNWARLWRNLTKVTAVPLRNHSVRRLRVVAHLALLLRPQPAQNLRCPPP